MTDLENESSLLGPQSHVDRALLGSWVNRRPALRVNSPAITQHLGFWIPNQYVSSENNGSSRNNWVKRIELFRQYLEKHLDRIGVHNTAGFYRRLDEDDGRRYQAVRLAFDWQTMPVTMNLELHHEYFTVTSTMDLSRSRDNTQLSGTKTVFDDLSSALNVFNEVAKDRFEKVKTKKSPKVEDHQGQFEAPYKELYNLAWGKFYKDILGIPLTFFGDCLDKPLMDFRGLVVSKPDSKRDLRDEFIAPAGQKLPVIRHAPSEPFDTKESVARAHTILPFMTAGVAGQEHTISNFLNGRCIYASALGIQPPEREKSHNQPLTYLVMATHGDRNQLGRLVDRIHVLGSVRIAALYDLPLISKAGDELHKLEDRELERIGKKLHDAIQENRRGIDIEGAERGLFEVSEKLRGIKDTINGGLPYRVERSRYYHSQFTDLVAALRIEKEGRIEGFQPYDQFVKHRLGSAYAFIDMVGIRYNRLELSTNTISQQIRTAEAAAQTRTIATLQEESVKQTKAASSHQSAMKKALFIGDYLGTFFVAPGIVLDAMLKLGGDKWFAELNSTKKVLAVGTSLAISAAFRLATGEVFRRESKRKERSPQTYLPIRPQRDADDYFTHMANRHSPKR